MGKKKDTSNHEGYKMVEDAIIKHSKDTQKRTDIDQKTKDEIVLKNAKSLDDLRKKLGLND